MAREILMPALTPTMEEGTLARWHVRPGDSVEAGQVIAEIETDKSVLELEALEGGEIGELMVEEGRRRRCRGPGHRHVTGGTRVI